MEQTVSWNRHRKIKDEIRNHVDLMEQKEENAEEKGSSEQKA